MLDTVPGFVGELLRTCASEGPDPDEWRCQITTAIITFFHTHSSVMDKIVFSWSWGERNGLRLCAATINLPGVNVINYT